jgi:hypothetical protein
MDGPVAQPKSFNRMNPFFHLTPVLLVALALFSTASCSMAPCTGRLSSKETFELRGQCNKLGAELDESFVGQYANMDDDDKNDLIHHVYVSHFNEKRNNCYVFLNRTHPSHFIEYVVDATSNQEVLQATTNQQTMNTVYRWYDPASKGFLFQVPLTKYMSEFNQLMEPPPTR